MIKPETMSNVKSESRDDTETSQSLVEGCELDLDKKLSNVDLNV